jgi:hypothetical protein
MTQKMGFYVLKSDKLSKEISALWPLLDVAVALITCGDRILAVYNDRWGAFTLPMTKRRVWEDPKAGKDSARTEEWEDAALRAAVEWMGRTTTQKPEFVLDFAEFQQSDRDEKWKRYHVQAYQIELGKDVTPPPSRITEWLTAEEFLDEKRRPISPTARHVVSELKVNGII